MNEITKSADTIRKRAGGLLVYTLFTVIASGMASQAGAQTFAEWFKQKSTQRKYLLQQIAALQAYAAYLKNGYQIAGHGLGSISACLHSENDLHQTYYDKLNTASSLVKGNPQVGEIVTWQSDIFHKLNEIVAPAALSKEEKIYIMQVRYAVLRDCDQQIQQLENIITDGHLEMSDAERLSQISIIHRSMQQNFLFANSFTEQVLMLGAQRHRENNNVNISKELYGIY